MLLAAAPAQAGGAQSEGGYADITVDRSTPELNTRHLHDGG